MSDFAQKVLLSVITVSIGLVVTFMAGERQDIQIMIYCLLGLIIAFGIWTINVRERRVDQEAKELEYREEKDKEEKEWRQLLLDRLDRGDRANRALLRKELIASHREWVEEKGYITLQALKDCENTYEVYHELGGNGTATKLWLDISALPLKD